MAIICYHCIVNFFAITRVLKEVDIHKRCEDKQQNTGNNFGNKNKSESYG